tara:strand:- start:58755 stop:60029 length:1275 start_codon:yes stop_codon:yes gene_type:complete
MSSLTVGYVGLSHLGLCSSVAAAIKNCKVISFDEDQSLIKRLNKGISDITEPHLNQSLKKYKNKIIFTNNINEINSCDIVYISLDVPTDSKGKSDLSSIYKLIKKLFQNISRDTPIVILCQVPPGFTRQLKWPSKNLFYQVETLIFGDAINRALNPERIIIGKYQNSGKINKYYNKYLKLFSCPIIEMNYESAEFSKISINAMLISSITTTNLMSSIAREIGANWDEIASSLRLDRRIGKYAYLNPGLGISGGNLERDLKTIINISKKNYINPNLVYEFFKSSEKNKNWPLEYFLNSKFSKKKNTQIGILGLSYKENTHSIKNSPSLNLIQGLLRKKFNHICAYDPEAIHNNLFDKIKRVKKISEVIEFSEILFFMTPWKEFKKINLARSKNNQISLIIDPYGLVSGYDYKKHNIVYLTKGKIN